MTDLSIEQLITNLRDKASKNEDEFINEYENNKDIIENALLLREYYADITQIISVYAHFLYLKSRFEKAFPYVERAIKLWEGKPELWGKPLAQISYYEMLHFERAVANYNLGHINDSYKDIKALVQKDPQNTIYKNWFRGIQKRRLRYITATLGIIGLACLLPKLLHMHGPVADLSETGFRISFCLAIAMEIYLYFSNPSTNQNN